jgi:energy-coupling factor transport system permease protein
VSFPKDVAIGQYCDRSSLVHRLDPRAKLLALLFFIISVFLVKNLWGFLIMASFAAATILLSHLPLRLVLRGLRPMAWLFASIMILHIFFADGGSTNPLFSLGPVTATWEGVYRGVRLGCRFLLVIVGATILALTTVPLRLADSTAEILRPLRRIGLPVHQLPIMMVIALHFIPVLFTEADKLVSAQKARGAQMEGWNIVRRLGALVPVLVPLLRSSLRRADELAVGMESRCYHSGTRSHLYDLTFSRADGIALAAAAATIPLTLAINELML